MRCLTRPVPAALASRPTLGAVAPRAATRSATPAATVVTTLAWCSLLLSPIPARGLPAQPPATTSGPTSTAGEAAVSETVSRARVESILDHGASVAAVEDLVALGPGATPALVEALHDYPSEVLEALTRLGDGRASYALLGYLTWALDHRPGDVSPTLRALGQMDPAVVVEPLRQWLDEPMLRPEHEIALASTLALLDPGEPRRQAIKRLVDVMRSPESARRHRIEAATALLEMPETEDRESAPPRGRETAVAWVSDVSGPEGGRQEAEDALLEPAFGTIHRLGPEAFLQLVETLSAGPDLQNGYRERLLRTARAFSEAADQTDPAASDSPGSI